MVNFYDIQLITFVRKKIALLSFFVSMLYLNTIFLVWLLSLKFTHLKPCGILIQYIHFKKNNKRQTYLDNNLLHVFNMIWSSAYEINHNPISRKDIQQRFYQT